MVSSAHLPAPRVLPRSGVLRRNYSIQRDSNGFESVAAMSEELPEASGAFADALVSAERIREFLHECVRPLKEEEEALAKQWRPGFRVRLPFYSLLDERQQEHLRGIFAHQLPDPDIQVDSFDREELILLDVLAETYVAQSLVFVDLMDRHEYQVVPRVSRDAKGRIIAMTLSASVFILDGPDEHRRRRYRYQNIYGNRQVEPDGRCRLKGNLRLAEVMRASEFRSSPLLMLAVHPDDVAYRMGFDHESKVMSQTFTSQMMERSFIASSCFQGYTNVHPLDELSVDDEDEDGEGDAPGETDGLTGEGGDASEGEGEPPEGGPEPPGGGSTDSR